MKKFITSLAAAAMLLSGCSSFLNVDNLGKSTIDGFFADTDGLRAAGLGLHRLILEFYDDDVVRYADLAADNTNVVRVNASEYTIKAYDFTYIPDDQSGISASFWKGGYEICTNANNILMYGDNLLKEYPQYEDLIRTHYAYAHFARALAIFELCNVFAQNYDSTPDASHLGVVAIDYVPGFDAEISRNTVKECYDLILSDLNKALELFGNDDCPDPRIISGLACEALLARVYLYMKDYDNAAKYANLVMAKKPLSPRTEYVNMFRRAQGNVGQESIFRLNGYDAGTGMRALCNPLGSQDIVPAPEFVDKFSDDDIRKDLFKFVAEKEDGEEFEGKEYSACCKYLPFKSGEVKDENRRCDPFVLRVSEMYLIHAEALCLGGGNLAEAAEDIKALRARALGKPVSEITLNFNGVSGLDKIIQEERAKELYMEGHRFYDLKRRGEDIVRPASTTSTTKTLKYPDHRYLLPIFRTEMEANENMVQNEGY